MTTYISSKAQKIMDGHTDKVSYRADETWTIVEPLNLVVFKIFNQ